MEKRKAKNYLDKASKSHEKKLKAEFDFQAWVGQSRGLDTFLLPHLAPLDICILRMCSKVLNRILPKNTVSEKMLVELEKRSKEQDESDFSLIPDFEAKRTIDGAMKSRYFKLTDWLLGIGFSYSPSWDEWYPEKAYLFAPFSEDRKHQENLLDRFVWKNPDFDEKCLAHIAYWGNGDLVKILLEPKFLSKHKISIEQIINVAVMGKRTDVLFKLSSTPDFKEEELFLKHGIRLGRISILEWFIQQYTFGEKLSKAFYICFYNLQAQHPPRYELLNQWIDQKGFKVDHVKKQVLVNINLPITHRPQRNARKNVNYAEPGFNYGLEESLE